MNITPDLVDRWYSAMVLTIGSPDDYRRWAFVYAVFTKKFTAYNIDSRLGRGASFRLEPHPVVVCAPEELSLEREQMVRLANAELAKVKRIVIHRASTRVPVTRLPRHAAPHAVQIHG